MVRACQLHAGLTGLGATWLGSLERLQDGTVVRHPVNRRFSCTEMGNHLLHLDGLALLRIAEQRGLVSSANAETRLTGRACGDWRKVKTVAWREANRERWRLLEKVQR